LSEILNAGLYLSSFDIKYTKSTKCKTPLKWKDIEHMKLLVSSLIKKKKKSLKLERESIPKHPR